MLAVAASAIALFPAAAQAHVSLHPNAIPAGSFVTTSIRVPNEEDNASTTVRRREAPRGGPVGARRAAGWLDVHGDDARSSRSRSRPTTAS